MLKYVSKFALDILPSVVATVIGAYIVTTYINPKSSHDAPKASAESKAAPENSGDTAAAKPDEAKSPEARPSEAKPSEAKAEPGKPAAIKGAASTPRDSASAKTTEARHTVKPSDKAVAKTGPVVSEPDVAAVTPAVAEERRDVNNMARSALERLRGSADTSKTDEVKPDAPKTADAPKPVPTREAHAAPLVEPQRPLSQPPVVEAATANVVPQPAVLPMGPPINIAAPRYSEAATGLGNTRDDNDARMVPPGEIPTLRRTAEAQEGRTTIADDVVSATRSMLRAVLP